MGFEKLLRQLDDAQRALGKLDGDFATVRLDPSEPGSIQAAIRDMEGAVDRCLSGYQNNPLVKQMANQVKKAFAEKIRQRASVARSPRLEGEEKAMDNTVFRQIENTVNDLKWADRSAFSRHIRKLSKLLTSDELAAFSEELVALVDFDSWLAAGQASGGSMVGSSELEWPTDTQEELGLTIALIHWLAEEPEKAWDFAYDFYYTGNNDITHNLQNMISQVLVPFGRDYIDYVKEKTGVDEPTSLPKRQVSAARKVFVVHGHQNLAKESMARFLERIGFEAIILHEQASGNRTIIEKIEAHSDVGFAVVLLTPDDFGGADGAEPQPRARQNVILELGYFVGLLGRSRVAVFRQGEVEVPSDFGGVVYIPLDASDAWKAALGKELEEAGFEIDWNKVMRR